MMRTLIVFESMYGNTRAVAEAIAEELGGSAVGVHKAGDPPAGLDLLIVAGPTHMHGMTTAGGRRMAADAAKEDGHAEVEPDATEGPGLRRWLRALPPGAGAHAAAFDTRLDRNPHLTGSAARGITRRLKHAGYRVIGTESFFVEDSEGPLAEGELERARAWAAGIAATLRTPA
jgi:hypothetical protein